MVRSPLAAVAALTLALVASLAATTPPAPALAPTAATAATTRPSAAQVSVTFLHYNIRHGSFGLDGVARDVARTGAQVVLLNEVDVHRRPGGLHQARYLARRLGMRFVYDANIRFRWGVRGNAVLTRFAVRDVERFDLPVPPGTRPRGLMRVRLATRGVRFDAWTSHLNAGRGTLPQARGTSRRIGDPTCATVLGIDVNAAPGSPEDRALRTHLDDVWRTVGRGRSTTNFRGTVRIDYLYHSRVRPRAARVTPLGSSDHRGVVGTFRIDPDDNC